MDAPFLGEIQMVAFHFAPKYWAQCNGAQMQTRQNQALYSLLALQFGGDGVNTFNLPDLRGRTPIGPDQQLGIKQGDMAGVENAGVTVSQMGEHTHQACISENNADTSTIGDADHVRALGSNTASPIYVAATKAVSLNTATISSFGTGSAPTHNNIQPSLVLKYVIATNGIYPTRQ